MTETQEFIDTVKEILAGLYLNMQKNRKAIRRIQARLRKLEKEVPVEGEGEK